MFVSKMVWGLPFLKFDNEHLCVVYECAKQSNKFHPLLIKKSISKTLKLLHINLFGPLAVESLHHKK